MFGFLKSETVEPAVEEGPAVKEEGPLTIVCRDYLKDGRREGGIEAYEKVMEEREKLRPIEESGKIEMRAEALNVLYPRLDLSFLSWKRGNNIPVFAVFQLNNSKCEIYTDGYPGPQKVVAARRDKKTTKIVSMLGKHFGTFGTEYTYSYKSTFGGIIPAPVREVIEREEKADRFDILGIIAECPKWQIEIAPADPLLIGVADGEAWLLAAFDTSKTEDYVVGLFTE
jgi:hypothetical protein